MASQIAPLLSPLSFELNERVYVPMDPGTQFGFISNDQGEPERVQSIGRIVVPVYDWQGTSVDEDLIMAKVMLQAAEASPHQLPSVSHVIPSFWTSQRGLRAFLLNPGMRGKFRMPLGITAIDSEAIPMNRLVLIGPADLAGYYVKQVYRRNIVCHCKRGLTAVQFYTAPS